MRVPVVYRAQPMWDATEPVVAASMHSLTNGLLPPDATLGLLRHMPPSYLTVEPGESHFMLGIDSYAQATSPLRRISDLIAHWQMKAALTGAPPPFDHTNLAFTIQSMRERERRIKRMQRTANEHWMKLFIIEEHHAVKRGERARRVVPAYVFDVTADGYVVFVKDFCLRTFLRGSRAKGTHRVGDWMNVAFRGMDRGFADVEEV